MQPKISKSTKFSESISAAVLFDDLNQLSLDYLTNNELDFLQRKLATKSDCVVYKHPNIFYFEKIEHKKERYQQREDARNAGSKLFDHLKSDGIRTVQLMNFSNSDLMSAFLEGLLLSAYSFSKYKSQKNNFALDEVFILDKSIKHEWIEELKILTNAVFYARNLVNEPLSYLTASQFSKEIEKLSKEAGFKVEIFNKKKIEALKMGGLLAVNKGSVDPPTFNILEWKPEKAKNIKPIVLVGKGVVYDTGGLSLKPTLKSMDYMKSDMAGAAVVASTIYAAAKSNLPCHLIGLIPATDNRPDGNAYVPGDVITMFDGTTVEIRNTDAEGRLILADALSYAKKYSPELVIDIATLTGAAEIVAGKYAIVAMGNSVENLQKLKETGEETFERIIEVPLWKEYAKPLKSNIADLNNLGTRQAQSTVAGKFLEHFTDYNWIHLDIAGVAFLFEKDTYRQEGGTGYGVRLLFNFLKKFN